MITSFADLATADIWNGVDSKAARQMPKILWPVIRRKLDLLRRVTRVDALRVPPGTGWTRFAGNRAGTYSIRVNDQFRITFKFTEGNAHEVRCVDYHS